MKNITVLFVALLILIKNDLKSELFSVIATNKISPSEIALTIEIANGKKFSLTYIPVSGFGSGDSQYSCTFNGQSVKTGFVGAGPAVVVTKEYRSPTYAGPQGFLVCYEILDNTEGISPYPAIASSTVVVPANATGDVDVLLEQSTDMITWTQCLPGTYNASTQKRFFRVRAVEK